ncbi:LOW QUALITY PROTEIN: phosphatidylinositol-3,5-bisphosphate 3-phosphatase MTMR4-like [Cariama cristata]
MLTVLEQEFALNSKGKKSKELRKEECGKCSRIVALAKILLDAYYRAMEGFQVLVESDWLDLGHKFGDRCGHQEKVEEQNEQCSVLLEWLDAVHQLLKQFPCLFEFNEAFLVRNMYANHTYSCLCGTFLGNSPCEREMHIYKHTCSVWSLLRAGNKNFHNLLYMAGSDQVLHPMCHVRALHVWTAVYLPASSPHPLGQDDMDIYLLPGSQSQEFSGRCLDRGEPRAPSPDPKTRSMDDLLSACESSSPLTRTSGDANLNNHCQEARVGLEARNATAEGAEPHLGKGSAVAAGETRQVEEQEEDAPRQTSSACSSSAEHEEHSKQLSSWASVPASSISLEAEKGNRTCTEEPDGMCPAPNPSRQENCLSGRWSAREGAKPSVCSGHVGTHFASSTGKPGRSWLPCHLKQASGPKHVPPKCPSPVPPLYLDDDGLPFPTDVIQHRLRQIKASYKQEVEQLCGQVRELQLRLDSRHFCAPPAGPPMDYEDDFMCLKESDGSDTEDFCSDHSEDCLSEASDEKETEVTRWVPDHMASHCFNCDCEFWLAKRRYHCRNCGNVFCAGCCHRKLPIPDQQLYDPVLVCNSCYDHIQASRARELMSQHLKKPIATASS